MHPLRYPNATSNVELVGTLLIDIALDWYLFLIICGRQIAIIKRF